MVIDSVRTAAYTIPTETPESDGTITWDSTTLIAVECRAGSHAGFGYTYTDSSAAHLISSTFFPLLLGESAHETEKIWHLLVRSLRNLGRPGLASMALSAVDAALWDLKGKLLNTSVVDLLGGARMSVPIYGSGGFTSFSIAQLERHMAHWIEQGLGRVKMKIGREPKQDLARVKSVRRVIGDETELFVDANGAYDLKQALTLADEFSAHGVTWFEEPVSSDDLDGLARIVKQAPLSMEIAAGEYGFDSFYFQRMLSAHAVDVLQADATRCGGPSGFQKVAALCHSTHIPLSGHCAPSLHAPLGCAFDSVRHLEYFFDHVRIESLLFDGFLRPENGRLTPDRSRPGFGIEFKWEDAHRFLVTGTDAQGRGQRYDHTPHTHSPTPGQRSLQ